MGDQRFRASCDACLVCKVKCSQTKPQCARCKKHGQQCIYSEYRRIGRPRKTSAVSVEQAPVQPPSTTDSQFCPDVSVMEAESSDTFSMAMPTVDSLTSSSSAAISHGKSTSNDTDFTLPITDPFEPFGSPSSSDMVAPDLPELSDISELEAFSLQPPSEPSQDFPFIVTSPTLDHHSDTVAKTPGVALVATAETVPSSDDTSALMSPIAPLQSTLSSRQIQGLCHNSSTVGHSGAQSFVRSKDRTGPGMTAKSTPLERDQESSFGIISSNLAAVIPEDGHQSRPLLCKSQCHYSLIAQLSKFSLYQSSQRRVSLDTLLSLDCDARQLREKVLRCTSCLGGRPKGSQIQTQILMFMIMIMENLQRLVENECDLEQASDLSKCSGELSILEGCHDTPEHGEEENDDGSEHGDEDDDNRVAYTSKSASLLYTILRQRRQRKRENIHCRPLLQRHSFKSNYSHPTRKTNGQRSSSSGTACAVSGMSSILPRTSQPLMVGAYQVDGDTHDAYSRYLIHLHFQRQLDAVHKLQHILISMQRQNSNKSSTATSSNPSATIVALASSDMNHRIASDMLADVYKRVKYFLGFIALTG